MTQLLNQCSTSNPNTWDLLTTSRQTKWNNFTSTIKFEDKSIYKLNHRLLHKPPSKTPLKLQNNHLIFDNWYKAELFADTMETQFSNNPGPFPLEVYNSNNIIKNTHSHSSIHTTLHQVWNFIKSLKSSKAAGHDNINNLALKHLSRIAIIRLTEILLACLRLCYWSYPSGKRPLLSWSQNPKKTTDLPLITIQSLFFHHSPKF